MTFSVIIAWLVIGFVIGGLAQLLGPGHQPIGVFRTLLAGMAGALLGGVITAVLTGPGHVINTFIVALIVSVLFIRAVSHPPHHRLEPMRRLGKQNHMKEN
jgi:uncharacterized membrane protein YeaQ/YmgE (transglycosylase-associated protein family)